jgi:hypothetical protein
MASTIATGGSLPEMPAPLPDTSAAEREVELAEAALQQLEIAGIVEQPARIGPLRRIGARRAAGDQQRRQGGGSRASRQLP